MTYKKLKLFVENLNSTTISFEELTYITQSIKSPILKAAINNYPIPRLRKIIEDTEKAFKIDTKTDVHTSKFKKNRSEIKEWLDIQCEGINFKSNEDYKTQLLAIFNKNNNENWLDILEDSYKEGQDREKDGIITDLPIYIEAIFNKYADSAFTGKESLYWLLENISKLEGEAQQNAEICLLDAINMARLAYDERENYFPGINGTRYSCMPGLHDRLLDTIRFYMPIEKKIEMESFIDQYYTTAVTSTITIKILPEMFIYAHNELINDKNYEEAYSLYRNNNYLYPNEFLIKHIKDKVCEMFGINGFYLDHLLSVSKNDDLLGMFSYILNGETNFTKTDIQNIIKEKLKKLEDLQNTDLDRQQLEEEQPNDTNKHMTYFVWDENIKNKLVGIIIPNIDSYTDNIDWPNTEKDLPCQEDLLLELVDEKRFDLDILNKLLLAAMKAGFDHLAKKILQILIKNPEHLDKTLPYVAYAVKYKRDEILTILLNANINVNIKNNHDNLKTALMYATMHNDIELINKLVANQADIRETDVFGDTALHIATICAADSQTIQLLIDKEANIDAKDNREDTPLHTAIIYNNIEALKLLITQTKDIDAKNKYGDTLLHTAVINNNIEAIKLLINKGADIKAINNNGETALHKAAANNNIEAIKLLLSGGANIEAIDNNGDTPLLTALILYKLEAINALLDNNANTNVQNKYLNTPLHIAAKYANIEAIKELITKNANTEATDSNGNTPLMLAIFINNIEAIELLIPHTKDINAENKYRYTPLHIAAKYSKNSIKLLLKKEADIECFYYLEDNEHNLTMINNLAEIIIGLDVSEIDINIINTNKDKLLTLAAIQNMPNIINNLFKSDEDIIARDLDLKFALILAAQNGNIEATAMLLSKIKNILGIDFSTFKDTSKTINNLAKAIEILDVNQTDINIINQKKSELLVIAIKYNMLDIIDVIHNIENIINTNNIYVFKALHTAAKKENIEAITILLSKGAMIEGLEEFLYTDATLVIDNLAKGIKRLTDNDIINQRTSELLFLAAKYNIFTIDKLTNIKIDINAKDKYGNTLLIYAVKRNNLDAIQSLIDKGADVQEKNNDGYTALLIAKQVWNIKVIAMLLSKGAKINMSDVYTDEQINKLAEAINTLDDNETTNQRKKELLFWAAKNNMPNVINRLNKINNVINEQNNEGYTALQIALENKNTAVIAALLSKGAKINMSDGYTDAQINKLAETINTLADNETTNQRKKELLFWAAKNNMLNVINRLNNINKVINEKKKDGYTALQIALKNKNTAVIAALLSKGAMINMSDVYTNAQINKLAETINTIADNQITNQRTKELLFWAAENNMPNVINRLNKRNNVINKQNNEGYTPLHIALKNKNTEVIAALFSEGAKINMSDVYTDEQINNLAETINTLDDNETTNQRKKELLFWVAKNNMPNVINRLNNINKVINAQDVFGNTPLHIAVKSNNTEVIATLITQGANIQAKNKNGYSPIFLALINFNLQCFITIIYHKTKFIINNLFSTGPYANTEKSSKIIDEKTIKPGEIDNTTLDKETIPDEINNNHPSNKAHG